MSPTVSVIIPTYNRAHLIVEALESVFAQTYADFEVIVVDDGSTDDTEEILAPYRDRIRYIKQENAGVSAARNHGIFEAKGEYIAFLDSDDIWFPEKLEKQMRFFENHPNCSFLCSDFLRGTSLSDNPQPQHSRFRSTSILRFEDFGEGNYVTTPSVLAKKAVFYKAGLFDSSIRVSEDYDLWIRIAHDFECWFDEEPLCFTRDHDGRTVFNLNKFTDSIKVYDLQCDRWCDESEKVLEKFRDRQLQLVISLAYGFRKKQDYRMSSQCLIKAIALTKNLRGKCGLFLKLLIMRFTPFVFRWYDSRDKGRR